VVVAAHVIEPRAGYPFRVAIEVAYEVSGDGLRVATEVWNAGDGDAPFGLGFHPYLSGGGALEESIVEVPAASVLDLDERGLPTGGTTPVPGAARDLRDRRPIAGRVLDDCFTDLERAGGVCAVVMSAPGRAPCTMWMDETFRYVMVFTGDTLAPPRRRRGVAVEPMTCPPNAFATGADLLLLRPGRRRRFVWGIRYGA
jgi:aldose 1-epimerase